MTPTYLIIGSTFIIALIIVILMVLTLAPLFRRTTTAKHRDTLMAMVNHMPSEPNDALDDAEMPSAAPYTPGHAKFRSSPRTKSYAKPRESLRRGPAQVVASQLRLPIRFQYMMPDRSKHLRYALVITALGYIQTNGGIDVSLLRCVCGTTKQWRSFQVAMISELLDMQTGEIVRAPSAWIMTKINPWI